MKAPDPPDASSLRAITWKRFLHAPASQLLDAPSTPAFGAVVGYVPCCRFLSGRVLAAAGRGFGGVLQSVLRLGDRAPRPAARLIVNEQLDPADLKALLATGDQSRLIDKLLKQF